MKTMGMSALLACVLLLGSLAEARVVTVQDTLDYTDTFNGNYFWDPDVILDHSPFFRTSLEDWDWTHDMQSMVPADANGIQSATVSILAWDVDTEEGEIDIVYANGIKLGTLKGMAPGEERTWTTTVFNLPAKVLQELWTSRKVTIFLDIDWDTVGDRVTLRNSTLSVNYTVPGGTAGGAGPDPNAALHRCWSPVLSGHFYTIKEKDKDKLIHDNPFVWKYDGIASHVFGAPVSPNLKPVYRFWSSQSNAYFYTISEQDKDKLIREQTRGWTYEGVAFYAYPDGRQPTGAKPVYCFWSDKLSKYFYTISEPEKQLLVTKYAQLWLLQGVAWYAYE